MVINDSNREALQKTLGTWYHSIVPLIESDVWDKLYGYLKSQSAAKVEIVPKSTDTWKMLQKCSRDKVRAIVITEGVYAKKRMGIIQSNGIPLDSSNTAPYQHPWMYQWQLQIEAQYGFHPDNDTDNCSLEWLLTEEHVLLLPSSLTAQVDMQESHQIQWHETLKWMIQNIINQYMPGIPVVLIGNASKFEQYLKPESNPIKKVESIESACKVARVWRMGDRQIEWNRAGTNKQGTRTTMVTN